MEEILDLLSLIVALILCQAVASVCSLSLQEAGMYFFIRVLNRVDLRSLNNVRVITKNRIVDNMEVPRLR